MKEKLKGEISKIEEKYRLLNTYNADDEVSYKNLIDLKKNCLLKLISKQDQFLALKKKGSVNH